MVPLSRARGRAWALLLAILLPTLWLAPYGFELPVDVENHSLKAIDTPEARSLAQRVASFGNDEELFVAFHALPVGQGSMTEVETRALSKLRTHIEGLDGVERVAPTPQSTTGARVWQISLAAPAGDYAPVVERVVDELQADAPSTVRTSVSGLPLAEVVLARELQAEQARVVPWVAAALALLLLVIYRHVGLVAAILVPPAVSISAIGVFQYFTGRELTPVSVLLQPVMLTVGVAAGVHWIESYLNRRAEGLEAHVAAQAAIRDLRQPALLASVTTVIGFLALAFNAIPAVADFGVLAAIGVAATYAVAVVLTPALLTAFGARLSPRRMQARGAWMEAFGPRIADALVRHAPAIRAGAAVIAVVSLALCLRLRVDNDPLHVLPEGHAFREDTRAVADELGGSEVFDVLASQGGLLAEPTQLGLFAAAVADLPGVAGPAGPALRSSSGDWLVRFVLSPAGSSDRERLFESVERRAAALGADGTRVTGVAVQVARDSGRMIRGALWSAVAGLALLWTVFLLAFRSVHFATLAIVPNALPCLVVNAGLVIIGAPLSFATAIISSTMLGLIVDDTIHLLHRFHVLRRSGLEPLRAIESVYQHSGRAILITSITLAVGFGVGAVGRLTTSVEFGSLAALTIATAFVADLVLLPALLVRTTTAAAPHPAAVHA